MSKYLTTFDSCFCLLNKRLCAVAILVPHNCEAHTRSVVGLLRRRRLVPSPTNQRTASGWRRAMMAETMKRDVSRAPANEFRKMSSYRECVCAMLKLFADFGKEVGWTTVPQSPVLLAGSGPLAHANVFSIPALAAAELPPTCSIECWFVLLFLNAILTSRCLAASSIYPAANS